jgi:hypothetical protein
MPQLRLRLSQWLLHVAAALVVRFLGELTVRLAAFHFATALVHLFAGDSAGDFFRGCECAEGQQRNQSHN